MAFLLLGNAFFQIENGGVGGELAQGFHKNAGTEQLFLTFGDQLIGKDDLDLALFRTDEADEKTGHHAAHVGRFAPTEAQRLAAEGDAVAAFGGDAVRFFRFLLRKRDGFGIGGNLRFENGAFLVGGENIAVDQGQRKDFAVFADQRCFCRGIGVFFLAFDFTFPDTAAFGVGIETGDVIQLFFGVEGGADHEDHIAHVKIDIVSVMGRQFDAFGHGSFDNFAEQFRCEEVQLKALQMIGHGKLL